jgi:antitoxin (DNA-binding transcriptional repressor) of toxin-antitoxin stability system
MTASAGRVVNVHEAKTHFSRPIDAAHAGESIVVAKGVKPWARLVPLEQPTPRRLPGVLEPLPEEELAGLEQAFP